MKDLDGGQSHSLRLPHGLVSVAIRYDDDLVYNMQLVQLADETDEVVVDPVALSVCGNYDRKLDLRCNGSSLSAASRRRDRTNAHPLPPISAVFVASPM